MHKPLKCDCESYKRWNQRRQKNLDCFSVVRQPCYLAAKTNRILRHIKANRVQQQQLKKNYMTNRALLEIMFSVKKMEISKLLVFFILSLDDTSAWDKFCRASCCLASLFSIVRWGFFCCSRRRRRWDLYSVQFNCKRVARQRDLRQYSRSCNFLCAISYRFACPPLLLFSYFVVKSAHSVASIAFFCPWIFEFTIVFTAKDLSRWLLFCTLFDSRIVLKT